MSNKLEEKLTTVILSVLKEGEEHYQQLRKVVENHNDKNSLGLEVSQ